MNAKKFVYFFLLATLACAVWVLLLTLPYMPLTLPHMEKSLAGAALPGAIFGWILWHSTTEGTTTRFDNKATFTLKLLMCEYGMAWFAIGCVIVLYLASLLFMAAPLTMSIFSVLMFAALRQLNKKSA